MALELGFRLGHKTQISPIYSQFYTWLRKHELLGKIPKLNFVTDHVLGLQDEFFFCCWLFDVLRFTEEKMFWGSLNIIAESLSVFFLNGAAVIFAQTPRAHRQMGRLQKNFCFQFALCTNNSVAIKAKAVEDWVIWFKLGKALDHQSCFEKSCLREFFFPYCSRLWI